MELNILLYQNDGSSKKGFPVKIVLFSKRLKRKTIGHSELNDWNEVQQLPRTSHPDYEDLTTSILQMRATALKSEFKKLTDFNQAFAMLLHESVSSASDVYTYFDTVIARMRSMGRGGTADAYHSTKVQFKAFKPFLSWQDVTPQFLESFKYEKLNTLSDRTGKKLTNKTVKEYVACLRALYNKALKDPQVHLVNTFPFEGVTKDLYTRRRRKKNRYLAVQTVMMLEGLQDLSPRQQLTVDFSLLQYYLGGVNLIDLYYLKKANFYKDRLMLVRKKLERYEVEFDVKVFEKARKIFEKYAGVDPVYLFDFSKEPNDYKTFRTVHYKTLQRLKKNLNITLLPLDQNWGTSVMRHTFATHAKFAKIDEDIIRELMGHERDDIDTVYKDKYPEAVRDAAHRKVIYFE
ncbi:phage integrase SAM-like domain-containing protein [Leeuwenhoekiella sp. LLG6367-2.1]|uniref:phage integrase SAM-like domain-containing protein n=1 Tax=Leeuwenhoekiella sp. LLG6367-2.1 TaxID=3160833 RepID=UPI0038664D49